MPVPALRSLLKFIPPLVSVSPVTIRFPLIVPPAKGKKGPPV